MLIRNILNRLQKTRRLIVKDLIIWKAESLDRPHFETEFYRIKDNLLCFCEIPKRRTYTAYRIIGEKSIDVDFHIFVSEDLTVVRDMNKVKTAFFSTATFLNMHLEDLIRMFE